MSVEDHTLIDPQQGPAPIVFAEPEPRHRFTLRPRRRRRRPKLRKLRFLLVLISFLALAGVSLLFGMFTAIASDLHGLVPTVPSTSVDSYLYDVNDQPIGVLAPPTQSVLDTWKQISPNMVHAIIAVEDKRYWSDPGIDVRGLIRAAVSDLTGGPLEGGSTIAEEFVKVKEEQEGNRTIFEKLREAALAYQLVHKWPRTTILTDYLNTIYFGNGANGIEAAARVYFGWAHGYDPANPGSEKKSGCGSPDVEDPTRKACAEVLTPAQAALLAGMVANPDEFDPILHPNAALGRRNQVLQLMYQQHYLTRKAYEYALSRPLPKAFRIQQPQEPPAAPYFTSWVRPLVINALKQEGVPAKDAAYEAYYGKLKIKLTINLQLQNAAQTAVDDEFPPSSDGPTASLVAIDNKTGQVRAMVSGSRSYSQEPFNLATLGYRQPGSAFKLFTLAAALSSGEYGPDSVFDSKPLKIPYTESNGHPGIFVVHNFGNVYSGPETLATATAVSDNSVFTQLGTELPGGTKKIAYYAKAMGIRSPISTNPAMIIGGLTTGVSALDMAHAYQTVANGGVKITNPILGDVNGGPIGIESISNCTRCENSTITASATDKTREVLTPDVAATIADLLHGPVDDPYGTGTAAAIPGVEISGKTGTTSNYVDAWFVGWTPQMTVAVWVGYPNSGKPMLTNFDGGPVEGGDFPAIIWHNFMVQALQIEADEAAAKDHTSTTSLGLQSITTDTSQTTSSSSQTTSNGAASNTGNAGTGGVNGTLSNGKKSPPAGTQPTSNAGKAGGATQGVTTTPVTPTAGGTQNATTTPAPPSGGTTQTGTTGGTGL